MRNLKRDLCSAALWTVWALGFAAGTSNRALALPIGFGTTQGDLKYSELLSDHFYIYHDERAPHEARMTLNALESARPVMEAWFGIRREGPLPVVISAASENASFANFITDAVELQTLGQGSRDLFWHEYVHSTMYRHLDNWFGPAGSILHLAWMPVWFIEGLAEALSMSVPSPMQASIERFHALNGAWPSYDRLHSLYGGGNVTTKLYATSGAFVTYILRTYDGRKLPEFLHQFYRQSMPWWWPWAAVPFNGFMPMDDALKTWTGKTGAELYEEYKLAATAYWTKHAAGPNLFARPGARRNFTNAAGLVVRGERIYQVVNQDGALFDAEIDFDKATGWSTGSHATSALIEGTARLGRVVAPDHQIVITEQRTTAGRITNGLTLQQRTAAPTSLGFREALIYRVFESESHILWFEHAVEETRLCTIAKKDLGGVKLSGASCPVTARQPETLSVLGVRNAAKRPEWVSEIWLSAKEETLRGDRYKIITLDAATGQTQTVNWQQGGAPVAFAAADSDLWMASAEKSSFTLRRTNRDGACLAVVRISDMLLDAHGLANGDLVLAVYAGSDVAMMRIKKGTLKEEPCYVGSNHTSPLLTSMRATGKISLQEAMAAANLWTPDHESAVNLTTAPPAADPGLDKNSAKAGSVAVQEHKESKFRGRHVLSFPWIGAEDALGPQIGVVSVPLMDHMQNETLRVTALVGTYSRFPNTDVTLVSTRFRPVLSLTSYRQQTYNGTYSNAETDSSVVSYLDENGVRAEADLPIFFNSSTLSLQAGMKYAYLKPYLGPHTSIKRGYLAEPYLTLTHSKSFRRLNWTNALLGRVAPDDLNEAFDYNVAGFNSVIHYPLDFLSLKLDVGVEGSRTRGKARRELQEIYRPLKTFIPGSGGGYNQNSFALSGDGSLFAGLSGDTQGRARANWSLPLVDDLEKFIWLFYFERLDLSGFYNYGGAWRGGERPAKDRLIAAHGYNLDLQFDNKGVNLNAGIGRGQVFGGVWQVYASFGFDALF